METLFISVLLILANYLFITYAFVRFGKDGLYACVPITIILANIQVVVTISFFGLAITLGNVAYASSYLITDLLGELYGHNAARKAVGMGFFSLIMMTVIMNIVLLYTPTTEAGVLYDSVANIFSLMPRIAFASLLAYAVSQRIDVIIYHKLKHQEGNKLWMRNNLSTMLSQSIDTLIFTFVAFAGVYSNEILFSIFISTYLIKFLVAAADTPFMYLGVKMANKFGIDQEERDAHALKSKEEYEAKSKLNENLQEV